MVSGKRMRIGILGVGSAILCVFLLCGIFKLSMVKADEAKDVTSQMVYTECVMSEVLDQEVSNDEEKDAEMESTQENEEEQDPFGDEDDLDEKGDEEEDEEGKESEPCYSVTVQVDQQQIVDGIYFTNQTIVFCFEYEQDEMYNQLYREIVDEEGNTICSGVAEDCLLEESVIRFTEEIDVIKEDLKDGTYLLNYYLQAETGEKLCEKTEKFVVDRTGPAITNLVYKDEKGKIVEKYGTIYSNRQIRIEFQVKDLARGVKEEEIYLLMKESNGETGYFANTNQHNLETQNRIIMASKQKGDTYYAYVPNDTKSEGIYQSITICAVDWLGNKTEVRSKEVKYHTKKPCVEMVCEKDCTKWTNQDLPFHAVVEDQWVGLKEVLVRVNGEIIEHIVFKEYTTKYQYDFIVKKSAMTQEGYFVCVEVTNNCKTKNDIKRQVYIDKQNPEVRLTGVENGMHYNSAQTIFASVTDVSFVDTKTEFFVKKILDGKKELMVLAGFKSNRKEERCSRKIFKEGDYEIYAVTTDGAGNVTISNVLHFVIDQTAPKTFMEGIKDGQVYTADVTIKANCLESFYKTCTAAITIEREFDGKREKHTVPFVMKNKKSVLTYALHQDGEYRITIQATDQAKNASTQRVITFRMDQTSPECHIVGTDNYALWAEPVTVHYMVKEAFYSDNKVVVSGTCMGMDGKKKLLEQKTFTQTDKVMLHSEHFTEDGYYELWIHSTDYAGNQNEEVMHFTIDRTAPRIKGIEQFDGGYYPTFSLSNIRKELFEDLTVVTHRMYLNGMEYDGVTPITEEGTYVLELLAQDELGHQSRKSVEFVIDATPPKICFVGVEDGETVYEHGTVKIELLDASDCVSDVRVNGKSMGADCKELAYTQYGTYCIEVDGIDQAGNAITQKLQFRYQNSRAQSIVVAVILAVLLVFCLCIFAIISRKRDTDKKRGF